MDIPEVRWRQHVFPKRLNQPIILYGVITEKTGHHLSNTHREDLIIYDSLVFPIAVTEYRFYIDRLVVKSVTEAHSNVILRRQTNTILQHYSRYYNKKYTFELAVLDGVLCTFCIHYKCYLLE
jgi:hypothetical protein